MNESFYLFIYLSFFSTLMETTPIKEIDWLTNILIFSHHAINLVFYPDSNELTMKINKKNSSTEHGPNRIKCKNTDRLCLNLISRKIKANQRSKEED